MRRRRGFFIGEAMVGLGILAVAATVLVVATMRQTSASHVLINGRTATRAAEAALIRLQAHLPISTNPEDNIQVRAMAEQATEGHHWLQVSATVDGQTRVLVGLVPDDAIIPPTTQRSVP
jgi:type II secretory pathway pseudopilin PulG